MSYYAANQPYNRVTREDGLVNGAFMGAGLGAAAAGGVHAFGKKGLDYLGDRAANKGNMLNTELMGANGDNREKIQKKLDRADRATTRYNGLEEKRAKTFGGGWKGKVGAYAGSAIAGGLLGTGIDAMNK